MKSNSKKYNQYSRHLRELFGCKVYKVTIDAGFSCPNRDGTISLLKQKGFSDLREHLKNEGSVISENRNTKPLPTCHKRGCIFCDTGGSFSQAHSNELPVEKQLEESIARLKSRFGAEKFISYFQAYTNTYAPVERLKELYDRSLSHPDVVGISIGTRPDCVDEEKLDLIASYQKDKLVWVEYGLQSVHDRTLDFINRGHSFADFVKAVEMSKERGINSCAHVIIGLPGESREEALQTAKVLADMEIEGVKLHLLCVLKDTELEKMYNRGEINILSEDEYVETVCDFLEILPPTTTIHRIAGNGLRTIRLAPTWLGAKLKVLNRIDDTLDKRDSYQGKYYLK